MSGHYEIVLKATEKKVGGILKNQIFDEDSFNHGGINNVPVGYVEPVGSLAQLKTLIPLYFNRDTVFYKSEKLFISINLILEHLGRVQRPDGTFDLMPTNFFSSPDTGFAVHTLSSVYKIVSGFGSGKEKEILEGKLSGLIEKCGYGMASGGFHTPNHRWVVASALMQAHNITKVEEFKNAALHYLAEGIDCDENGEYAERSAGIYNATNDNSLIILAEELGQENYLEYVRKNLEMMFTYMEPDGSIFTMNSRRQDKDKDLKYYPAAYYQIYLYMAGKFRDGRYMAMANRIMELAGEGRCEVPDVLYLLMLYPDLKQLDLKETDVPEEYRKFYEKSGIVRARKERYSYTLLKNSSSFLFFQVGQIRCHLKMCASFFAVAQFKAETIEEKDNGYIMKFKSFGYYRLPFEDTFVGADYWQHEYKSRPLAKMLELDMQVRVEEIEDGISLAVATSGCDRVPFKLEFCISPDTVVKGDGFMLTAQAGQNIAVSKGNVEVCRGEDKIQIGPGFANHIYTAGMRGSEPAEPGDFTMYFTDFTNVNRVVEIKMA